MCHLNDCLDRLMRMRMRMLLSWSVNQFIALLRLTFLFYSFFIFLLIQHDTFEDNSHTLQLRAKETFNLTTEMGEISLNLHLQWWVYSNVCVFSTKVLIGTCECECLKWRRVEKRKYENAPYDTNWFHHQKNEWWMVTMCQHWYFGSQGWHLMKMHLSPSHCV